MPHERPFWEIKPNIKIQLLAGLIDVGLIRNLNRKLNDVVIIDFLKLALVNAP